MNAEDNIHCHADYRAIQDIEREIVDAFRKSSTHVKDYIDRVIDSHVLTHWAQHYVDVIPRRYLADDSLSEMRPALLRVYIDAFVAGAKLQARRDAATLPVPDTAADLVPDTDS